MKKVLSAILAIIMCVGMLGGCRAKEQEAFNRFLIPHNTNIKIAEKKEDIIKKDRLILRNDIKGWEEPYTPQGKVEVCGYEFDCVYGFNDQDHIGMVRYTKEFDIEAYNNIKLMFDLVYVERAAWPNTSWERAVAWENESGGYVWEIKLGEVNGQLWIYINVNLLKTEPTGQIDM